MKRTVAVIVAGAILVMLDPSAAVADQTYLRESDAPKAMFPDSVGADRRTLDLSELELKVLSQTVGRRIDVARYPYLDVRKQNETVGFIFILDVVGQSRPITFAVGVALDGSLRDIEVMVYREPQGEQIQEARFRRQFAGKRLKDPITLGRDIDVISGASISSRSATYAARKALSLAEILSLRRTTENTR
jgi:electron transport complex protein RnfG